MEAGSIPGVGYGRFGRMFDFSQRLLPDECLLDIAKSMIKVDLSKPIQEAEAVDENPSIPSGYTYFGQFIDHDISLDPTPLSAKRSDIAALEDFRTPALDLDCIYGRGPDDQPYMYTDGLHLRLGKPITADGAHVATKQDVLRLDAGGGKFPAILGDKRNDENRIVAQIQSVFIAFHNKVVDDAAMIAAAGGDFADGQSRFRTAAMLVRWHYQWLVVNDFLPRILETGMVAEVLNPGGTPRLDNYDRGAKFAYMPVEFAGAAYRFGHSMVRPGYALNKTVGSTAAFPNRVPIFNRGPLATDNLNGFGVPMPHDWAIDWSFFLDGLDHAHVPGFKVPQPSYRIDANLVDPLADLPEFRDKGSPFTNLAYRNLARGVANLRLPSGEQVALALGIVPLTPEILWGAGSKVMDPTHARPRRSGTGRRFREDQGAAQARLRQMGQGGRGRQRHPARRNPAVVLHSPRSRIFRFRPHRRRPDQGLRRPPPRPRRQPHRRRDLRRTAVARYHFVPAPLAGVRADDRPRRHVVQARRPLQICACLTGDALT